MNILMLPSWYPTNENPASGIFFRDQAQALQKQGINIFVLFLNAYGLRKFYSYIKIKNKCCVYDDNGVRTYMINYLNIFPKMRLFFFLYSAWLLKKWFHKLCKDNDLIFDLVHIHSVFYTGIFYLLSKIPVKFVITEHSTFYSRNLISYWDRYFIPKVFSSAAKIIAVGYGLKNELAKFTKKDIIVIFNMILFDEYNKQTDKTKTSFRFFSLGKGYKKKGFDILISAFSKVKILNFIELFIAGLTDTEIKTLQEMCDSYRLKNVKLLGSLSREEVSFNMNNCDCFILPSRFETFGIVFAEAMSFGKPVIATITGGPDSFVTSENGILVHVENIDETRDAIENMYFSHKKYDGNYIMEYARKNFSSENIAKKIIDVYNSIPEKSCHILKT